MRKTIYFLRSAPYDYKVTGMDLYDSFNAVIKKEFSPPLNPAAEKLFSLYLTDKIRHVKTVYSSPDKRCIATAKLFISHPQSLVLLHEVDYTMENFITKDDFYREGKPDVKRARVAFVQAFIANQLEEQYESVMLRIDELLKVILCIKENEAVMISHGFYLKVIEAYLRDTKIKNNPKRLQKIFSGDTETYKFFEGFIVEVNNNQFMFKNYIRNSV